MVLGSSGCSTLAGSERFIQSGCSKQDVLSAVKLVKNRQPVQGQVVSKQNQQPANKMWPVCWLSIELPEWASGSSSAWAEAGQPLATGLLVYYCFISRSIELAIIIKLCIAAS
jgi:hypothetical protein